MLLRRSGRIRYARRVALASFPSRHSSRPTLAPVPGWNVGAPFSCVRSRCPALGANKKRQSGRCGHSQFFQSGGVDRRRSAHRAADLRRQPARQSSRHFRRRYPVQYGRALLHPAGHSRSREVAGIARHYLTKLIWVRFPFRCKLVYTRRRNRSPPQALSGAIGTNRVRRAKSKFCYMRPKRTKRVVLVTACNIRVLKRRAESGSFRRTVALNVSPARYKPRT